METLACSLILHITIIDGLAWQALYQLHKEHLKEKRGEIKIRCCKNANCQRFDSKKTIDVKTSLHALRTE